MTDPDRSPRITREQRLHETPYTTGYRKGRIAERRRIIRILTGRVDPYDEQCPIVKAIHRIQRRK